MKRKRFPNGKNTLSSLLGYNGSSEWQKAALERQGGLFIGLALEASLWKKSPEK
jgi:hypothetical protein